jgi:hypothetical protein
LKAFNVEKETEARIMKRERDELLTQKLELESTNRNLIVNKIILFLKISLIVLEPSTQSSKSRCDTRRTTELRVYIVHTASLRRYHTFGVANPNTFRWQYVKVYRFLFCHTHHQSSNEKHY